MNVTETKTGNTATANVSGQAATANTIDAANIPAALTNRPQWVLWKTIVRNGEETKVPFTFDGRPAKANDPTTWTEFDEVLGRFNRGGYAGVGYEFSADDPFCGIDLDGCRNSETTEVSDWAKEIIVELDSYAEISPSGTGIKIWIIGKLPFDTGKKRELKDAPQITEKKKPGIEAYDCKRYFAMTGWRLEGPTEPQERQQQLNTLCERYFPVQRQTRQQEQHKQPSDDRVIERARKYLAEIPPAVSGSGGHNATFHAACVLVHGFALDESTALSLLDEWNARCQPPWSEGELRHKLADADKETGPRGYLLNSTRNVRGGQRSTTSSSTAGTRKVKADLITNAKSVVTTDADGKKSSSVVPLTMPQVLDAIQSATDGWPRRIGAALFIDDGNHGIGWLSSTAALFGWLANKVGTIRWHKVTGCVDKSEVYAELSRVSRLYLAVETMPHVPPIDGCYYCCSTPDPGDGKTLSTLLDRFCPLTDIDRDLILSAFATTIWGGPGGARPAFVITSDIGRGVGKTRLATMIGEFAGGLMDFDAKDDMGVIKTRLLSPEGLAKRVVLLDNVKSLKFSWSALEAVITTSVVSGKRLYVGEGSRPNTITWTITLNGASLSTDMAQRSVIIKLRKAVKSASWEEDTKRFIAENRQAILADLVAFFGQPQNPPATFSRWAAWEGDVLSRLPEPEDAQRVIGERQGAADVEKEEADIIEDHFRERLEDLHYDTETETVFISNAITAKWFNEATNSNSRVTGVSRTLRQMFDEQKIKHIQPDPSRNHGGRGFLWIPDTFDPEANTHTDLTDRITILTQNRQR